nr:PREDICTED: spermatogenesis-associated protein 7 isoform X3 [Lepisosteus oculatus]
MGYIHCTMETRKVNVTPVPRYSLAGPFKGHMSIKSSRKSAAYCPGSSNKLTNQYMIQDHMMFHYKKVLSAKAAVDSTAPKSLLSSVKYSDQQRRERLKKKVSQCETKVISAQTGLQKTSTNNTRPSSADIVQSCASLQGNDEGDCFHYLESHLISSPRFAASCHSSQFLCQSSRSGQKATKPFYRSSSESGFRSPFTRREHSTQSYTSSSGIFKSKISYNSFHDPNQKTYSGDLLQKHSHCFTEDKPFTPKTLKKETKSSLSQYRYYTPPRRKPAKHRTPLMVNQDTQTDNNSFSDNVGSPQEKSILPQDSFTDHEWSFEEHLIEDHLSYENLSKIQNTGMGNTDQLYSLSRIPPERMKSPTMRKVTAEEEELRVLERVFERHFEMNKHRLDNDKMRHLLDVLRHDLGYTSDSVGVIVGKTKSRNVLFSKHVQSNEQDTTNMKKSENHTLVVDLSKEDCGEDCSTCTPLECEEQSCSTDLPQPVNGTQEFEEAGANKTESELIPGAVDKLSTCENDFKNPRQEITRDIEDLEKNLATSLFVSNENNSCCVTDDSCT